MTFESFTKQLESLINTSIIPAGITDVKIIEAMRKVPRHLFVPDDLKAEAYIDAPLPIGHGQTISQPSLVGLMTQLLKLKGSENALEIGTGSGYQTAILAKLAKNVTTIERIPALAYEARKKFKKMDLGNIEVVVGDGTEGYAKNSPYDAIIVTAGAKDLPQPLADQLSDDGRLVIPTGGQLTQNLMLYEKKSGKLRTRSIIPVRFVPMIGKHGWDE